MFLQLLFGKTDFYSIQFWGVHVADVTMIQEEILFHEQPALSIEFTSRTSPFFTKMFPVDNYYSTIVRSEDYRILDFKKESFQPHVNNSINTTFSNGILKYENSETIINDSTFNIFSFLNFLQNTAFMSNKEYSIEREGLKYTGWVETINNKGNIIQYKLHLSVNSQQTFKPVFNDTDIFTWAIFKKNVARLIWVNTVEKKIIQCQFNSGIFSLSAKLEKK